MNVANHLHVYIQDRGVVENNLDSEESLNSNFTMLIDAIVDDSKNKSEATSENLSTISLKDHMKKHYTSLKSLSQTIKFLWNNLGVSSMS